MCPQEGHPHPFCVTHSNCTFSEKLAILLKYGILLAMRIQTAQHQVQRQVLSPIMQQSIEILLLNIAELSTTIEQELQDNPLLEVNEENQIEDPDINSDTLKDELNKLLRDQDILYFSNQPPDNELFNERPINREDTLEDKLLRELRTTFDTPLEIQLGEFIIGSLDKDGYLTISAEEIAEIFKIPNINIIENILKTIQSFGPPGIAARDLKECLLIQVNEKFKTNGNITHLIIHECLNELGKKQYDKIAKELSISLEKVKEKAQLIASLDPKPARNFRPLRSNTYITPDVSIVITHENAYKIFTNRENTPKLRISATYKSLLKKNHLSAEDEEFIREKLKNAILFMRSIEQRGQTIKAIAQCILERQKNFFENGYESLVPMSLKDVAEKIDRNESTISRAISNKYMDTPQGLFPMKFFFAQGVKINGENGQTAVSNRSIKEEVKQLVDSEDKSRPISDQEIKNHFDRKGTKIARRTISKYRQALHILPTHLRKQ